MFTLRFLLIVLIIVTVFPHIVSTETLLFQRSQDIRPKVTVHKCAETIQGRKLFKGGNYMRKYGTYILIFAYAKLLEFSVFLWYLGYTTFHMNKVHVYYIHG